MAKDKGGITIEPEAGNDGIVHMSAKSKILQLVVTNQVGTDVNFRCAVLGWPGPFKVDDLWHHIVNESKEVKLAGRRLINFTVTIADSPNPGVYSLPVAFMFRRDDDEEPFHIVKYIRYMVVDDVVTRLQPTRPYRRPKPVALVRDPNVEIERGQPPEA